MIELAFSVVAQVWMKNSLKGPVLSSSGLVQGIDYNWFEVIKSESPSSNGLFALYNQLRFILALHLEGQGSILLILVSLGPY